MLSGLSSVGGRPHFEADPEISDNWSWSGDGIFALTGRYVVAYGLQVDKNAHMLNLKF